MDKTFYVISYDISDPRRLQQVARIMEDFGQRVLYSVFECLLTQGELIRLKGIIEPLLDPLEDKVLYYPLCSRCKARIECLGPPSPGTEDKELEII